VLPIQKFSKVILQKCYKKHRSFVNTNTHIVCLYQPGANLSKQFVQKSKPDNFIIENIFLQFYEMV